MSRCSLVELILVDGVCRECIIKALNKLDFRHFGDERLIEMRKIAEDCNTVSMLTDEDIKKVEGL